MRQIARRRDQRRAGHVIGPQKIQQVVPRHGVECLHGASQRASERLVWPKRFIEQFLDVMLRLIEIHRQLFFDDAPFLFDFDRIELRVEKHVHQHVEQFVETIVPSFRVKARAFFAGEGVEVTADAFHGLRNLFRGAFRSSFEQEVLDEVRDAVQLRRFVTTAHSDP